MFQGNVSVEYPDDYYEMDAQEVRKFFAGDLARMGVRNVEKHTLLSVGKTKDTFLNWITDAKSVLAGAENSLKRLTEYRLIEEFDAQIMGKTAKGIRFSYKAKDQDVYQFCEMAVVKMKGGFYVVYCASRLSDREENAATFAAFRASLKRI